MHSWRSTCEGFFNINTRRFDITHFFKLWKYLAHLSSNNNFPSICYRCNTWRIRSKPICICYLFYLICSKSYLASTRSFNFIFIFVRLRHTGISLKYFSKNKWYTYLKLSFFLLTFQKCDMNTTMFISESGTIINMTTLCLFYTFLKSCKST